MWASKMFVRRDLVLPFEDPSPPKGPICGEMAQNGSKNPLSLTRLALNGNAQTVADSSKIVMYPILFITGWPRFGSVRLRFGDGTVRAVPVFGSGGSSCFSTASQRGRFRFRFRFLENGSGGSGSAFDSCENGSDGSGFRFRFGSWATLHLLGIANGGVPGRGFSNS